MKKFLDLSVPLGVIEDYADFKGKGKLGKIQRLLERHCGISLRIDKLQAELKEIENALLEEDPKIFDAGRGFRGAFSIPLRPELKQPRRSSFWSGGKGCDHLEGKFFDRLSDSARGSTHSDFQF